MKHDERESEIEATLQKLPWADGRSELTTQEAEAARQERVWAMVEQMQKDREPMLPDHDDDAPPVRTYFVDEFEYLSRFDKAMIALRKAEAAFEAESDPEKQRLIALRLPKLRDEYRLWHERGANDMWREKERVAEWRATTGKDTYNASRRKRETPNVTTTEPVTPVKINAQKLASKRRRMAARTPEQIAAAKEAERLRGITRRAATKAVKTAPK